MCLKLAMCIFLVIRIGETSKPRIVDVGAILNPDEPDVELAFRFAVSRFNLYNVRFTIHPYIQRVSELDNFKTGEIVCEMVQHGIAAIFGPGSSFTNEIVQSVSEALEIPQFQLFWNPKLGRGFPHNTFDKPNQVFNLYPEPNLLAEALASILHEMLWKTFTIIYEHDDALIRLQEIMKYHVPKNHPVIVRKLTQGPDHRTLLKEIRSSKETQIILDCDTDHILDILEQAKEVNLMEEYYSYLLTSLDAHTLDYENFSSANITTLRLVDPATSDLRVVAEDWEVGELTRNNRHIRIAPESIRAKAALIYDAVSLFITIFQELDAAETLEPKPLSCYGNEISDHGFRMAAYGKVLHFKKGKFLPGPLTGPMDFDSLGRRKRFRLQVVEHSARGFQITATWFSNKPKELKFPETEAHEERILSSGLKGKFLRVTSRIGAPYFMEKTRTDNTVVLKGNDRYEGYVVDLLDNISKILGFTYEFYEVPDKNYGGYDETTKEWDGLVKELLDRKADLATCDLTITYDRHKAVDFTMPFMTLGISILYTKAEKAPPALLTFMHPLSFEVWLHTGTAILVISMILYLVARLTPADWENPHPCNKEPEELENVWNLKNCFWLTMGSIMTQGCDILPKGISTRMVTGVWWFFCLIVTQSYTANLAAFLTTQRMGPQIESVEDLAKQTRVKYGLLEGGATATFFKNSNFSTYQRMWTQMKDADINVFEKDNKEGVKRVKNGKQMYAYLMESSSIDYEIERDCNLMQVGPWLDVKGYGIAMRFDFQHRSEIDGAILKLQENRTLIQLKNTWWKEKNGGGQCKKEAVDDESAAQLDLANLFGVFVILAIGSALALIVAIIEFLWNVQKIAAAERMTLREALVIELKFAMDIRVREKSANRKFSNVVEPAPSKSKSPEVVGAD